MTIEVFWQQIAEAINGECEECPVYQYAIKTNTKRMCDLVCVCAEGLMALHKKLQEEDDRNRSKYVDYFYKWHD